MRFALAVVILASTGCGKQLSADFCAAHPTDQRCIDAASADAGRDDAPADVANACPADYTLTLAGMSSRYKLVENDVSWPIAQADCGDDGATTHLIVINNDAERLALAPHTPSERHVGYSDGVTEGTWIPVTDDPDVYAALVALSEPPWNGGEPNEGSAGNCLTIGSNLAFRDRDCDADLADYVCECDGFATNPANF